jgi:hypothetical protein
MQAADAASAHALQVENESLRARVAELEKERAAVPAPAAPTAAPKPSLGALASQLIGSPAMREVLARSQKQTLQRRFSDLMDQLGLSPADRARFIDVLAEKQMNSIELGMKMMGGTQTAEESAATVQQMKDAVAAGDAKIRDFFGADATSYAAYQDYVAQQPVRTQLTAFSASLAAAGQPMNPEQNNALAGVIADTRRNFTFTHDFELDTPQPPSVLNGPALETFFQEQEQLQGQIADRAATFLSPEQLAALRQSQASRLELSKKSLNAARQMFGGGK